MHCSNRHRAAAVALIAGLLALGVWAAPARAQDEFDVRLFRPVVTLSASATPSADFQDIDGTYGATTYSLAANIPIGPAHIHETGAVRGHQFLLSTAITTTQQHLSLVDRPPRLYTGVVAGSMIFLSRNLNLYYAAVGGSAAEDRDTVHDPRGRFFGVGLGSHVTGNGVMILYGGAYTYLYGRGLVLPIFGLAWRPATNWTVLGVLPFTWRVTQHLTDRLRMSYLLGVQGQQYRFANPGTFAMQQDDPIFERLRESHLGAEIEFHATSRFSLLGEAGVVGGRRLAFADAGRTNFFDEKIDPAGYAKMSLRFLFGPSLLERLREGRTSPLGEP